MNGIIIDMISLIHAAGSAHLILLDFIVLIIVRFVEKKKWRRSALCRSLHNTQTHTPSHLLS
jgi:hypothetical protein